MSWVAAGVSVIGGIVQYSQGKSQQAAGERMEANLNKPVFQIPREIEQNMSYAEKMAFQGLPEEQKQQYIQNQQRRMQTAMMNVTDRRGGLGMVSQLAAEESRSNIGLMQADVAARQANMERLMQSRQVMADYRMKGFEHQYNQYSADLDYARAMQGAGQQNVMGGFSTALGGLATGVAGYVGNIQAGKQHARDMELIKEINKGTISDRKLKQNIVFIKKSPSGLNIYNFEYKDSEFGTGVYQGVMSDEIPQSAVIRNNNGYDMVDYSKIDVDFIKIKN
tara:strand:+ start:2566 stop:3402 length:837 start_codon:yes stop_codon:yes gene_type:complete